jgi:hypothetical protein
MFSLLASQDRRIGGAARFGQIGSNVAGAA